MEGYKNLKEDKEFFPYEYGSLIYNDAMMNKRILDLFRRKELESNMDLICNHMEENGVVFSSPGGSFQRKLLAFLTRYMNYRLRHPHRAEILKKDDKLRQLIDPLAKIICTEKNNLEEWGKMKLTGTNE